HELADLAPDGLRGVVDDVGGRTDARPGEARRFDRADHISAHDPAADLGAAGVVDDRAATLSDLAEIPPPWLGIPRLPGRPEDAKRRSIVGPERFLAVRHRCADHGR